MIPLSTSFDALNLHPELRRGIAAAGFEQPTPIQQKAIPPAMEGRDILACAMTGSGKTAAFLLPILQRLRDQPRRKTRALVLTPTRELAAQIVEHGRELAAFTGIRLEAIFGGMAFTPQEKALQSGTEIIVACPGRLLDHFGRSVRFPDLDILVLDEADRMLDMGFLPDVKRVLKQIPKPKQTLLFSATLPGPIVELAGDLLKSPAMIDIDRQSKPSTQVDQAIYPVPEGLKRFLLAELLERNILDRVLVFTRTKHRADRLAQFLIKRGITADRIHANRTQNQRTRTLAAFKDGEVRVLVATDIAARGIDVEALEHVVNFDVPNVPEDYVHRVGRTGRAAATGEAFTFVGPHEETDLRAIERTIARRLERRTLEGFDYKAPVEEKLEIPLADRLAAMRAARAGKKRPAAPAGRPAGRQDGGRQDGGRQDSGRQNGRPQEARFDGRPRPEQARQESRPAGRPAGRPSGRPEGRPAGRPEGGRRPAPPAGRGRGGDSRPAGSTERFARPAAHGDDRGNRAPMDRTPREADDNRGNRVQDDRGNRGPQPRQNRAADRFPEGRSFGGGAGGGFRHAGDDARRREQIEEGRRRQALDREDEVPAPQGLDPNRERPFRPAGRGQFNLPEFGVRTAPAGGRHHEVDARRPHIRRNDEHDPRRHQPEQRLEPGLPPRRRSRSGPPKAN
jgi:ATP-dependent RNA helicase RhlE